MPTKSKIYTKTGDKGTTRLVDCQIVAKNDARVEAYGTCDELNSFVGELRERIKIPNLISSDQTLERIQNLLFNMGSLLACADPELIKKLPQLTDEHIAWLEEHIDKYDSQLTELQNFILPAGSPQSTAAHLARTVCRRLERKIISLDFTDPEIHKCLIFTNRLSDFLFVFARYCNMKLAIPDVLWTKP